MSAKSFSHTTERGVKSEIAICSAPAGIRLTISGGATFSGWFSSDQGAEIALAVLEASGVEPVNHSITGLGKPDWLEGIAHGLQAHIEHEDKLTAAAKAEAEAQAKLEAEALELENAGRDAAGADRIEELSEMGRVGRDFILAVARKAREINKEESNA